MTLPLSRMTTRRWMIVVAVVGLVLLLMVKFEPHNRQAERYARWERYWSEQAQSYRAEAATERDPEKRERTLRYAQGVARVAAWYGQMKRNYRSVRFRPWLPVAPAPPVPYCPPPP